LRNNWQEFSEAVPAFITMLATPLTFSIATGLSLGLICYTVVKVAAGKIREVNALVWILNDSLYFALHLLSHSLSDKYPATPSSCSKTRLRPISSRVRLTGLWLNQIIVCP